MDARATNVAAIREQCGRKLKEWVSYKIAICMLHNLNACTRMDLGFFYPNLQYKRRRVPHKKAARNYHKKRITKVRRRRSKLRSDIQNQRKDPCRIICLSSCSNLYFLFFLELFGCIPRSICLCLLFSSRLWTKFTCSWMTNNPMGSWLFFYVVMVML